MGHFVNYRKQVSPSMHDLLPEDAFRLFAVCARFPQQLRSQVTLEQRQDGVFDCDLGIATVRIIVAGQMAEREQNAMLHLFSAQPQRVEYGRNHYQQHSDETSTVLQVLSTYREEGVVMPYTMEDFKRELREEVLAEMSPAEILKAMSPEEILQATSPAEILKAMSSEQMLQAMQAMTAEQRQAAKELLAKLEANDDEQANGSDA